MAATTYATLADFEMLVRPVGQDETDKVNALLEAASAIIREKARLRGKDFDAMIAATPDLSSIARVVVCDMTRRAVNVDVSAEAMSQVSQSALGYTVSGTYAVPGGGLYIMENELKRLGLMTQRVTVIDPYEAVEA